MRNLKKKNSTNKHTKNAIASMLCVTVAIIAIACEIRFPISYTPLQNVFNLFYSIISVILGIWITCYLLVLQLFKDRYPFNILSKEQLPSARSVLFLLGFDVLYGAIIALINNYFWSVIVFCLLTFVTISTVFRYIYNAHKTLMVNTYIDNFFDRISADFNSNKMDEFECLRKDIWSIFDECVIKEEYFVARNIAKKTGTAFRDFLTNSIKIVETVNSSDFESAFKKIVEFNIDQLELCRNIKSDILTDIIIAEQKKNLSFCIKHDRYEWYKEYTKKYSHFVFEMQKEKNKGLTEKLYYVYFSVLKQMVEEGKKDWIEHTLNEIESLTITYIFAYNEANIQNYSMLISELAAICIKENNHDIYLVFEKKLEKFAGIRCSERGIFNEVKLSYAYLFQELIKKDLDRALGFLKIVMNHRAKSAEDSVLVEFKIAYIEKLSELIVNDPQKQEMLLDYQISAVLEAISLKKEYDGYYDLPNFFAKIKENEYAKDKYEKIIDDIRKILNHCIIKDNVPSFYTVMEELKTTLSKTKQRQKDIQIALLHIYLWLFTRTLYLVNQQFFEISLDQFKEVILLLDKNREISVDLGKFIIEALSENSLRGDRDKEVQKLISSKIDLLFSFMQENTQYNFVVTSPQQKRLVSRNLFNIGTECIENGLEEGVRKVSNAIGWLIIFSIKQGTGDLTTYLIERANELFYIAKKMEVTQKTQMFMLTLFTTVGAYCCKDLQYNKYLNKIIEGILDEDIERINVAVRLRTSENDMWNDLYDNKTNKLTEAFVSRYKKKKEAKK